MVKIFRSSKFFPNYIADSILDIEIAELIRLGCRAIIFDVDETLMAKNGSVVDQSYIDHIQKMRSAGVRVLIGSNSRRDLSRVAKSLGATVVRPSLGKFKPLSIFYARLIAESGFGPESAMMVGDRVINDIIGANIAGLQTVLVKPFKRRPGPMLEKYIQIAKNRQSAQ